MTPHDAYVILNLLPRVGPIRVKQLLQHLAGPAQILTSSPAELRRIPGIGEKLADILGNWRRYADLEDELAACRQSGTQLVTLADEEYPEALRAIHDPPLCLYVRGQLSVLQDTTDHGLAMVGSRRITHYGQAMAERLAAAAVQTGWIVVSGLARGIDTIVHQTTLKHEGRTVAVIAGGLQHITPPENIDLARRITETGCVISEQPLRMAPDKRMFPMRNRLIAGLCRGTLVVEAGAGSGSLITAELALEQGRAVFAVPGRADTPHATGCHKLIKDGAKLVEGIDDVLDEFQHLPGFERPRRKRDEQPDLFAAPAQPAGVADLPPIEQALIQALSRGERQVDELLAELQQPAAHVLSALLNLELKRLVRQHPGRRYSKAI